MMAIEVTNVESMQWNRTQLIPDTDGPDAAEALGLPQISPEVLAEIQAAISAEVANAGS